MGNEMKTVVGKAMAMRLVTRRKQALGTPFESLATMMDSLEREMSVKAEQFADAAEWLARKLTRAAKQVRECRDFRLLGHEACELRSTSLLQGVPNAAAALDALSGQYVAAVQAIIRTACPDSTTDELRPQFERYGYIPEDVDLD